MLQDEPLKDLTELQQQLQEQSWENALGYLESEMLEHIKLPEKCKKMLSSSINSCYFIDRIERLLQKDEYKVLKPKMDNDNDNKLYSCILKLDDTNYIEICIPFSENTIQIKYNKLNTIFIRGDVYTTREGNNLDKLILEAIYEFKIVFDIIYMHNVLTKNKDIDLSDLSKGELWKPICETVYSNGEKCTDEVLFDGTIGSDKYCFMCLRCRKVLDI